jgi:hypothetical protein
MNEFDSSHDTYSCRESLQIGGNYQLLRIYVDGNVRMD